MAEEDPNLLSEGKKQEDDADNEIAVTDGTLPKEIDEVLDICYARKCNFKENNLRSYISVS